MRLLIFAPVAQLDRASDSDSEGRWFDSSRVRQKIDKLRQSLVDLLLSLINLYRRVAVDKNCEVQL